MVNLYWKMNPTFSELADYHMDELLSLSWCFFKFLVSAKLSMRASHQISVFFRSYDDRSAEISFLIFSKNFGMFDSPDELPSSTLVDVSLTKIVLLETFSVFSDRIFRSSPMCVHFKDWLLESLGFESFILQNWLSFLFVVVSDLFGKKHRDPAKEIASTLERPLAVPSIPLRLEAWLYVFSMDMFQSLQFLNWAKHILRENTGFPFS